jgi:hypothetical protein
LAIGAVIEAFRNDSNKHHLLIYNTSSTGYYTDSEFYKSTVLEIADQLYKKILMDLVNSTMMTVAASAAAP